MNQENNKNCCALTDRLLLVHTSPISNVALLLIRIASTLYFTYYLIYDSTFMQPLDKILYFTYEGYFFTWLYFLVTVQDRVIGHKYGQNMRYFIAILYYIAFCEQIVITVIFWTVLYGGFPSFDFHSYFFNVHLLPLIALSIDFIFNSFSFNLKHYLLVLIPTTTYMFINMAYSLTVYPIYGILDWKTGLSYGVVLASYALYFLGGGFGLLVFKCLKEKRLKKMFRDRKQCFEKRDLAFLEKMREDTVEASFELESHTTEKID